MDPLDTLPVAPGESFRKKIDEEANVLFPVPQGGNGDGKDIEPVSLSVQ